MAISMGWVVCCALVVLSGCVAPSPTARPGGRAARRTTDGVGRGAERSRGWVADARGDDRALPESRLVDEDPAFWVQAGRVHRVQSGETLYSITKKYYGDGRHYRRIWVANRNRLTDPRRLRVGMKLIIP